MEARSIDAGNPSPGSRVPGPGRRLPAGRASFVALLLALACGGSDESPTPPAPAPAPGTAPTAADARADAGSAPASDLEPGQAIVEVVGGRVRLESREAPRLMLLERLAGLEGFVLEPLDLPPREISLQLRDASLATAVDALLDDVSYRTQFRHDPELGRNRLVDLVVGESARVADADGGRSWERRPRRPERERVLRPLEPVDDAELARLFESLEDPSPDVRIEAIAEIDPEGDGLYRLLEVVRDEPDPRVRSAAVEQLESSDTHAALEGLLAALRDPDRAVVLAAISALEFAGDETVLPHLAPLRNHPDPEVREAAQEAAEFLE